MFKPSDLNDTTTIFSIKSAYDASIYVAYISGVWPARANNYDWSDADIDLVVAEYAALGWHIVRDGAGNVQIKPPWL